MIFLFSYQKKNFKIEICFNNKHYPKGSYYNHPCRTNEIINYLTTKGINYQRVIGNNYFNLNPYTVSINDVNNYPF